MKKEKEVLVRLDGKYKNLGSHLKTDESSLSQSENYSLENDEQKIVDFNKRRQAIEESRAPFWDDGKREHSPKLPPSNRKKKEPVRSFDFLKSQLFLSVMSAILVGGAFGLMLLSLFTGNEVSLGQNQSGTSNETFVVDTTADEGSESPTSTISPLDLHLVQGGAFSTVEKGNEMADIFQNNGLPAVLLEEQGTHYLFVGMALDKEGANAIASKIEDSGHETYVKPFAVTADRVEVDQDLQTFLSKGIVWMELASNIAVNDITKGPPSEDKMAVLFDAGQAWLESYDDLSVSDDDIESLSSEWMKESQSVMAVYSSNVSSADFAWEMQESLLNGMLIYKDLISVLE